MPRRPVNDMSSPGNRLDEAIEDLTLFRRKWNSLGRPALCVGSKKQLVPHPLIRMIRDAERAVVMLSVPAAVRRGGRPPGSASAPDRKLTVVPLPTRKSGSGKR